MPPLPFSRAVRPNSVKHSTAVLSQTGPSPARSVKIVSVNAPAPRRNAPLWRACVSHPLIENDARLRLAEENYAFEVLNVQTAQATLSSAEIEAGRQVRYLSMSVAPIAPDEATYPRSFENTLLAFLIFSGIYLMISLTSSILREQVSS